MMKFAILCCILWIAVVTYILMQNGAECYEFCNLPKRRINKGFKAFINDFVKYCNQNKNDVKCNPAVRIALKTLPSEDREELVEIYLRKKLARRNVKNGNIFAAKDALGLTICQKLDGLAQSAMNFELWLYYGLQFDTEWDLFKKIFLDNKETDADAKFIKIMNQAYKKLESGNPTEGKYQAFMTNLNADLDVICGLGLFYLDSEKVLSSASATELTVNVIQKYEKEVKKYAEESIDSQYRPLLEKIMDYNQDFLRQAARKEAEVGQSVYKNLRGVARRVALYRSLFKSFVYSLYDKLTNPARVYAPNTKEAKFITEYDRAIRIEVESMLH